MKNEKPTQRKQNIKKLLLKITMLLLILVGLLIALYPFYVDSLNGLIDQKRIEQAQKKSVEETNALQQKMTAENERLQKNGLNPGADPFKDEKKVESTQAELIGSINIPKININLPLYDETTTDVLEIGAGVLQGTSFPTGGKSTHSVISAHSGLPNRLFFTDLEELKIGDQFILTVLDKKLAYQVDAIEVVMPDDTSSLTIQEGRDLVTLLTCTPYMVNSHRLLVTGYRIPYNEAVQATESKGNQWRVLRYVLILVGVLVATLALIYLAYRLVYHHQLSKKIFDFSFTVLDTSEAPITETTFRLMQKGRLVFREGEPVEATSDPFGRVEFKQLPGGQYQLVDVSHNDGRIKFGVKKKKESAMLFISRRKRVKQLAIGKRKFIVE
ncbi:class C sortase [Enterococcus thailandicus]|uniref:class C sortase n=1 Tax=Enterococcus thailandicus TaxID=417368 RepID=UPI003985218F